MARNESRPFPEISTHQRWSQGLAGISAGNMARGPRKLEKVAVTQFPASHCVTAFYWTDCSWHERLPPPYLRPKGVTFLHPYITVPTAITLGLLEISNKKSLHISARMGRLSHEKFPLCRGRYDSICSGIPQSSRESSPVLATTNLGTRIGRSVRITAFD